MKTIIVPMAGRGTRFQLAGYNEPKMLIPVQRSKTILDFALEGLLPHFKNDRWIFICLESHLMKWPLREKINALFTQFEMQSNPIIHPISDTPRGQLCSVLQGENWLDPNDWLVIHNCDTYITSHFQTFKQNGIDGFLPVFHSKLPIYSYVDVDSNGWVTEVKEKKVLDSFFASTGTYIFRKGADFLIAAEKFLTEGTSIQNEYYVSGVYDYLIDQGFRFKVELVKEVHSLGTPKELSIFKNML